MKLRGRIPGVPVDPRLIRRARLEAGLSMAQLAGANLSRQAIFLIEKGRTRPSAKTLEFIAARTGKPTAFFFNAATVQPENLSTTDPDVAELQALCLQQQFDKAIELGQAMLQRQLPPSVEAHVRQYVGQSFVRSSRPDEAFEHLGRAKELLNATPDPWLEIECADWEACALYLKEDQRALPVAERALKLCRATQPRLPGTEARILEHIATIHVKNHTYDRAIAYYQEALETAGSLRDLPRLGRTYHGLSIAYQERGDLARATEFTHKALALYALEDDTALMARGENELGLLLMRQGQMARAEDAFRAALGHFDESGTLRAKSHVLLSLAELQARTGRIAEAMETTRSAIELATRLDEKLALSTAHQLMGQLEERAGRPRRADREFLTARRLLQSEGLIERLAENHAAYAEILEARNDVVGANRHWKLAAKSALARDRSNAAGSAV